MAARTYRVVVSPDGADHVTRVLLLDGRASLHDLHLELGRAFGLPPSRAAYAFFTSGRAWDESTMFTDPRAVGRRADKALLFRLGLKEGQELAYVLGFEVERHFRIRVLDITDAERPLPSPVLVASEGGLSAEDLQRLQDPPEAGEDEAPTELRALLPLAEQLLTRLRELEPHEERLATARAHSDRWDEIPRALEELRALSSPPSTAPLQELGPVFRAAGEAALRLVRELHQDLALFAKLDEWLLEDGLGPRLLDLPLSLSLTEETDLALELSRELSFIDPDLCGGDSAVILARAGRSAEALAQVEQNLAAARDEALAESKAGDVHRALGDNPAAEAYYRRSLAVSKAPSDRLHAVLRLAACLMDAGRDAEASELLAREGARGEAAGGVPSAAYEGIGRNDPCPCGSGKKFKKCHGV